MILFTPFDCVSRLLYIGKLLFYCFFILLLTGCEKEFNYTPVQEPVKAVLYSFLEEDSVLRINLSQSLPISTKGNSAPIPRGTLSVFVDSVLLLSRWCGNDTSWLEFKDIKVKAASTYQMEFESDEITSVIATSFVPKHLSYMALDTVTKISRVAGKMDSTMVCKITFKDSIQVKNYYQLTVFSITQESALSPVIRSEIDYPKSDKIFLSTTQSSSLWSGIDFQGLFTDDLIDGKQYTISIALPKNLFVKDSLMFRKSVEFAIYSLSYEYFEYYRSRKIAEGYQGVPFLDPVQVYSNVENGLGCVGGLSSYRMSIDAVVK